MNDKLYFGLGLLVSGGWRYQNPQLNGWTAVSAYLHARKLTVSLVTTKRKKAADGTLNPSAVMAKAIAEYLAPGRTLTIPTS